MDSVDLANRKRLMMERNEGHGSLLRESNRGVSDVRKNKALMEKEQFDIRAVGFKHKVMNAFDARINEMSDKEEVPMPVLLHTIVKLMPKQVEAEINHNFTFADMVAKCSIELEKLETIDVESKELDEPSGSNPSVQEESD
jgi:hypothetical protein